MRTLNIKYTYCVTLNNINKLDGYVRPPQIIVLLLQQKDVHLCNDYKSFSQLFGHSSCNNNFDKQPMYFHNNFLVHITIWKCKNKCVLLILFNVTKCVLITDTTPFVLVNRCKSLGLEFSLTFLYIDTRMFLPFNCQYNPNIGFLIICLKFCQ